jgi:hypothetical protein
MSDLEDKDALRQHYSQLRDELLAAIDGLSDALMSEPSLDIALWDDLRASDVARISSGHESAWRMTEDQVVTYNELGHDLRQPFSVDQARWELTVSRQRLLEAIAAATPRGLDASLYGEAGLLTTHEAEHAGWIRHWRATKGL